jgi:hypothetical protein
MNGERDQWAGQMLAQLLIPVGTQDGQQFFFGELTFIDVYGIVEKIFDWNVISQFETPCLRSRALLSDIWKDL